MILTLAAPHLGGAPAPDVSPLRIVVALIACLLVAALAILMLRQRMGGGGPGTLMRRFASPGGEIVIGEVRRLGLHGDVATVRHAGREYLLLVQAGSAQLLRERELPAEVVP